eukprot:TRINITY_DN11120_c0_g2_i2.p1 TRINITY_DN11120_c0_g2~~TRINITY_DN11120_c0_g2_i2.p1  ORF type:complete len:140 (-),score=47.16 TRINITY_DN11120_c0_g2_i2:400-771(-)
MTVPITDLASSSSDPSSTSEPSSPNSSSSPDPSSSPHLASFSDPSPPLTPLSLPNSHLSPTLLPPSSSPELSAFSEPSSLMVCHSAHRLATSSARSSPHPPLSAPPLLETLPHSVRHPDSRSY